jgi:L-2-hydroxyglutarate oxidase
MILRIIYSFNGFWKLLFNHKEFLFKEFLTSFSKYYYLKQCLKYYQSLEISDLLPYRCGIRAQAVDQNGEPVHDFVFESTSRCLFVLNAPSPAATSSIPIGKYIVKRLSDEFNSIEAFCIILEIKCLFSCNDL